MVILTPVSVDDGHPHWTRLSEGTFSESVWNLWGIILNKFHATCSWERAFPIGSAVKNLSAMWVI